MTMAEPAADPDRFDAAVEAFRKRVPMSRDEWDLLTSQQRERAFMVSKVSEARVIQDTFDAIDRAVAEGGTLQDFKDAVAADLIQSWGGEIPGRLETIFRTNVMTAYGEGRHAIMSSPTVKQARPYWRYDDSENDRECDVCNGLGGTILPADDPWWETHSPPIHFNCSCVKTPLSQDEAEDEGIDTKGPRIDADDGFGEEPSHDGTNWDFDLSGMDPELRSVVESALKEAPERPERPEPASKPERTERKTEREPELAPREVTEPEPTAEEKIQRTLDEYTERHLDDKREVALVVSPDSGVVLYKEGTKNSVYFSAEEVAKLKDTSFVHNHPGGNSLSPDDLYLAIKGDTKNLSAVGRSQIDKQAYSYSFTRPAKGWPTKGEMQAIIETADLQEQRATMENFMAKKITILEADKGHWHRVWERVQARIDIGYRRDKIKG